MEAAACGPSDVPEQRDPTRAVYGLPACHQSGFTARLFGDGGAQVVKAVLIAAVVVCSGVIALYEFRLNPMADTERGEWTSRQLFYATVFTITFFVGFLFILTVVF
jgi:hypothetical protein